ncbi:DUF396-domain-containing protein [Meredithblackwellia eburnea MCA 4105]
MISVLHLLSYVAVGGAFIFVLLSLASGLLYVAEIIEEHANLAKVVGQRAIYFIIAVLAALHFLDGLPLHIAGLGILCHLVYLQNFSRTWPSIALTSLPFLASCVLVVVSHLVSFSYFSERARGTRHHYGNYGRKYGAAAKSSSTWSFGAHKNNDDTFLDIATYFGICVWLIPMFLFLSLSANDNVLPSAGDGTPNPQAPQAQRVKQKQGSMLKGVLTSALSLFLRPPRVTGQRDGLIATPIRSGQPSPNPGYQQPASSFSPLNSPSLNNNGSLWGSGTVTPPRIGSPSLGYPSPQPGGGSPRFGSSEFNPPPPPPRRSTTGDGGGSPGGHRYSASESSPRPRATKRPSMDMMKQWEREASPPPPPLVPLVESTGGLVKRRAG